MFLTGMVPPSVYDVPYVVTSCSGSSDVSPPFRANCVTSSYVNSSEAGHGGDTGCVINRRKFRVAEVRFLPPRNHPL
jgi:hypothetical protein